VRAIYCYAMQLLERDNALTALERARESAGRGEGRVVYVTGEPGIGKSSLVELFVEQLDPETRVLLGTCDDLSVPRPLGPIRDLSGSVSAPLERALAGGAAPHELQSLLLAELEQPPRPTVLVLEDVHWADDATCDAITVIGRRIASLPALLVLTFRAGEAPPGHPLHAAIGAIRADDTFVLELAPLSEGAVASLAGDDARGLFAATGGNPFYVTELLAWGPEEQLPPSVANAVLGRAARLDPDSQELLQLVSVVPTRMRASLLDVLMADWAAAAEEPERRHLLEVGPTSVRFRHELARNAIGSSLPTSVRRGLHARIVRALLDGGADPSDVVHHAEAAGDEEVVAEYALLAARRAAALDSNREAYTHFRRAVDFAERLDEIEQAALQEELAGAAYLTGRLDDAFHGIERAIEIYRGLGEIEALGRCTRVLSRFHWFAGDGAPARHKAHEAIAILEPLGESVELARAYSGLSQLSMLAQDVEAATIWGYRALDLARRLGDQNTFAHALVNIGTAKMQLDARECGTLLEAHMIADACGSREEATRALTNLAYTSMAWARPQAALDYARRALAYAEEHEAHLFASYISASIAWLLLRAGQWPEAERLAVRELERGISVPGIVARTVLAELAVRRGDDDAAMRLVELASQAERAGDLQRIVPVLELETELGLTSGRAMPVARLERLVADARAHGGLVGWSSYRIAAFAALAGLELEVDPPAEPPFSAMAERNWAAAADAFGRVGWGYDRALMLSLLDDEDSLVEALETARSLGAVPLARRAAGRMRALGLRVPRGPREATRANAAGLTARQLEVLELLVDGLTNAEIADRLVVSPRTAEHHVAAVLAKLGASTRREAARRASRLHLLSLVLSA
jgi:DNA-binding CsgD family transcriptional regulator/tetratricopeptide (TPR) repeat protein